MAILAWPGRSLTTFGWMPRASSRLAWVWRPCPHLHELRGAPEPNNANVHAPVHSADQRVQQEGSEPEPRSIAPLHVLQLLPYPSDPQDDSGGRVGPGRSRLVD